MNYSSSKASRIWHWEDNGKVEIFLGLYEQEKLVLGQPDLFEVDSSILQIKLSDNVYYVNL